MDELGNFHPAETFSKAFGSLNITPEMRKALGSGTVDPRRILGQLERQAYSARAKGVVNVDIHDEQFLLSPKTGDIWWVDWGLGKTGAQAKDLLAHDKRFQMEVLGELKKETHNAAVVIQDWRKRDAAIKNMDDYADLILKDMREAAPPPVSPQLIPEKTGQAKGLAAAKRNQQAAAQRATQEAMWRNAKTGGRRHNNAYERRVRRSRNPADGR